MSSLALPGQGGVGDHGELSDVRGKKQRTKKKSQGRKKELKEKALASEGPQATELEKVMEEEAEGKEEEEEE